MGERPLRGREPSRRRGSTEQLDWSHLEPFEEGRAGDLPNDDRALFGDFASQSLDDAERLTHPQALQQSSRQLRLRGAGHQPPQNEPLQRISSPGAGQPRQGAPSRFTGRSRSSSGTSSLQEGHRFAADAAMDAGEACGEAGPSETSGSPQQAPKKRGKKKLPLPDLDAIKDPDERRRQRRLVKNRNTAAASRQRKAREVDELNTRMDKLEQENAQLRRLLEHRDLEIGHLQQELAGTSGAAGGPGAPANRPSRGTGSGGDRQGSLDDRSPQQLGGSSPSLANAAAACSGLTASGVAAASMSGFVRGVDGQYLRLRPGRSPPLDAAERATQPSAAGPQDQALGGMQQPEGGDRSPGASV
ncbi:hypothetical protein COCOBI_19-1420 [Coccomyxa sp. Obi]|nr:hypothetical protein COCOBI_19-1420 [Coccomyxa sp. Obi]